MAKGSPAFLMYARDFYAGTAHFSSAEVGAYVRGMCWSWDNGPLPLKKNARARAMMLNANEFKRIWPTVSEKWIETPAGYVNQRLEQEREKQAVFREKQANNGRASAIARATTKREPTRNQNSTVVEPERQPKPNFPRSLILQEPDQEQPSRTQAVHPSGEERSTEDQFDANDGREVYSGRLRASGDTVPALSEIGDPSKWSTVEREDRRCPKCGWPCYYSAKYGFACSDPDCNWLSHPERNLPQGFVTVEMGKEPGDDDYLLANTPRTQGAIDRAVENVNPAALTKIAHGILTDRDNGRIPALDVPGAVKEAAARADVAYDSTRVRKALDSAEHRRQRDTPISAALRIAEEVLRQAPGLTLTVPEFHRAIFERTADEYGDVPDFADAVRTLLYDPRWPKHEPDSFGLTDTLKDPDTGRRLLKPVVGAYFWRQGANT